MIYFINTKELDLISREISVVHICEKLKWRVLQIDEVMKMISNTDTLRLSDPTDYRYLRELFPCLPELSKPVLNTTRPVIITNPWANLVARNFPIEVFMAQFHNK